MLIKASQAKSIADAANNAVFTEQEILEQINDLVLAASNSRTYNTVFHLDRRHKLISDQPKHFKKLLHVLGYGCHFNYDNDARDGYNELISINLSWHRIPDAP